ncbi:MAG: ArsB/NhaD family transporter [candidate division WOR-3 bacterium]|nr:ArsB/NhaD family transporter [candidate division WOR-3 bacterium]
MSIDSIIALIIFLVVYFFISTEKINKTIAVLIGAMLFIFVGFISQEAAFEAIDWNVIFLLIGMMIIVGVIRDTGFFQYVAVKTAKSAGGNPYKILILLVLITAVFSAFLDNVTTIVILTPITILIAEELDITPVPFVISEAIASNIGGTATLVGDPPNIMIGSAAQLSFLDFLKVLSPVVIIILSIFVFIAYIFMRGQLHVSNKNRARIMEMQETKAIEDKPLMIRSLVVLCIVIAGFLLHDALQIEASSVALFGAALLMLLSGRDEIDRFFHEVEWSTIFFFIGLFILVGGLAQLGIIKSLSVFVLQLTGESIDKTMYLVLWMSGLFSAFVDNIPYVATMIPVIKHMGEHFGMNAVNPIWWALSLGACLGGNGTLIGASANVLSIGIARKSGYKISFWQFTKHGFVIMIISLIIATIYLSLIF